MLFSFLIMIRKNSCDKSVNDAFETIIFNIRLNSFEIVDDNYRSFHRFLLRHFSTGFDFCRTADKSNDDRNQNEFTSDQIESRKKREYFTFLMFRRFCSFFQRKSRSKLENPIEFSSLIHSNNQNEQSETKLIEDSPVEHICHRDVKDENKTHSL